METNVGSTHSLLSAVRQLVPDCRFYFACSSEAFGHATSAPQNEDTPFNPRSVYGISKVAGFHLVKAHRENHGLLASSGILFNHESPRRGLEFVTRKITQAVARIKHGKDEELRLGNLDARRDWGFAGDFVQAMWLMLQQDKPDDFVIATGETRTIREFCQVAFDRAGLDWEKYVVIDERFFRPAEVNILLGDATKASKTLGWKPETSFEKMVQLMVDHDLQMVAKQSE